MAEADIDAKQIEANVNRLSQAMERVRDAQADRDDVVVEMRQAARTRLEMLARDLQPVFNNLPEGNDQFEFALTGGDNARLWIDMTSFVRMGRDRRAYEFVKDTRLGRTILAASASRGEIAQRVTDYVAERVIQRERAIEGDWIAMKDYDFDKGQTGASSSGTAQRQGGVTGRLVVVFLLGLLAGAAGMVAWAWFGTPPVL